MDNPFNKLSTNRLSTKIILMVEVVLILSNSIFCVVSIINSRGGIRKSIQQRMLDIANCASGSMNGDILGSLSADDENSPRYKTVYDTLAIFRDNVELEYVYSIKDEGDGRFTFIVDTDPEAPGAFGAEVKYTEALASAAKGKAAVDEVPYTDAWGQFYSAYSPVYDSSGKVAGIIAADFSSEWFNAQLSEQTLSSIGNYCVILLVTLIVAAILSSVAVAPFVHKQEQLAQEVKKKAAENEQLFLQIVKSLADAVDAKDPYTNGHSRRVSQYSVMLAEALGWEKERIDTLRYAALLHDIGKIGVPDSILNSPKRLSKVEYGLIKSHAGMGGDILKNEIMDTMIENVARCHHEWFDGTGYPMGLKGECIPEEARIAAIADAFDAMSSDRVYRKACAPDHIRQELENGSGKQFDPNMVKLFIKLWDKGLFDSIIESKSSEDEQKLLGAPSEIIHNIIENYASKGIAIGSFKNTDCEKTEMREDCVEGIRSIENKETHELGYSQFTILYEYIANLEKQYSCPFQLIMISLDLSSGENPIVMELEREMNFMELSIRRTISSIDIMTRFGKQQFLIVLLGTDSTGANTTIEIILRDYFKIILTCTVVLSKLNKYKALFSWCSPHCDINSIGKCVF